MNSQRTVKPEVYVVGETKIDSSELNRFLSDINAPLWKTDTEVGAEILSEVMGRLCYRSFDVELNRNLTRIREGNELYLRNVIASQHGSVLEHGVVNFIFRNLSRIVTHELVRHRAGTAISQESLRFVRLESLNYYLPTCFRDNEELSRIIDEMYAKAEEALTKMVEASGIDAGQVPFSVKKELTSAFRRIAPDGLATTIGWSCNFRALRHVIELRTSRHAEEEIRILFAEVAKKCLDRWPNLFQDHIIEVYNDIWEVKFGSRKI